MGIAAIRSFAAGGSVGIRAFAAWSTPVDNVPISYLSGQEKRI
jgi:hypothetical protein